MRLAFAAKTVLWFRKFPLGHLEVFPEKMKMPKNLVKKYFFQVLHQLWKESGKRECIFIWSQGEQTLSECLQLSVCHCHSWKFPLYSLVKWSIICPFSYFQLYYVQSGQKALEKNFFWGIHLFKGRCKSDIVTL